MKGLIHISYYISAIKNYFDFDGRARRKEFWLFSLITSIILLLLFIFFTTSESSLSLMLFAAFQLFSIIPSISVTVRRLHDIGKSGVWYLISFIPMIGGIWLLILVCTNGQPFENEYGVDPKSILN